MKRISQSVVFALLVAALLVALIPATTLAQSNESTPDTSTDAAHIAHPAVNGRIQQGVLSQDDSAEDLSDPTTIEAEIERQFNELRREQLDDWATSITWWLEGVAIFLTFFGVFAVLAGFFWFQRFEAIRSEAKESANEVKRLLEEIKQNRDESRELLQSMAPESDPEEPEQERQTTDDVTNAPGSTTMGKAVAEAISLQEQKKTKDAIRKWLAIAEIAEGRDNSLAARAWFSYGYLEADDKLEDKMRAYDKTIILQPDSAAAYNNRGIVKNKLGRFVEAIADYDEAIRLRTNYARAYYNRGLAKARLKRFDEAITDYDEAIRLQEDYVHAYYSRGTSKRALGRLAEARKDYESALKLAREENDADRASRIEEQLQQLNTEDNN